VEHSTPQPLLQAFPLQVCWRSHQTHILLQACLFNVCVGNSPSPLSSRAS
jgi:hypothetical protein